jgi:hypothetical protein
MQRESRSRKAPSDPYQLSAWLRTSSQYVHSHRKQLLCFRETRKSEIDRIAASLRKRQVFFSIEDDRWRAAEHLALEKVAEAIIEQFEMIEILHRSENHVRRAITTRDAMSKASRILRKAGLDDRGLANDARWFDAQTKNERESVSYKFYRPTLTSIAATINALTLNVVAILAHTTTLTPSHIAAEIAPGILETAWDAYPELAPKRGAKDPQSRYKDALRAATRESSAKAKRPWTEADQLQLFRFHLFAGDDRFPVALFEPHKTFRSTIH